MKTAVHFFLVFLIFLIASCGTSINEKEKIRNAILDSIRIADSIENVKIKESLIEDSIAKAEREKAILDSEIKTSSEASSPESNLFTIAKNYMESAIFTESKGAFKLVSFLKQNGVNMEIHGQKRYELEYLLTVQVLKHC